MIKKQPILVLLMVGFVLLAGGLNLWNQRLALNDSLQWTIRSRELQVLGYLNVAKEMGAAGRWDELQQALDYARQRKLIDFYALQDGDSVIWYGERDSDPQKIPLDMLPERVYRAPTAIGSAVQLGTFKVTIGIDPSFDPHEEERGVSNQRVFNKQLLLFGFALLVVAIFALKDLLRIVRKVRSGKISDLSNEKSLSQESDLFLRGLTGYAQTVSELEAENLQLGNQVLPSLKKEILSGKKPPYDFNCTMVRTDINQFSNIYNTHNVTEFMATINEFFKEVSLVVARYNGLVHEFVGDEVIYYFKDDDHGNSFAVALSAVRDVNRVAEKFHKATLEARGYPFTVKSSLAHGKVRFGPLVNGYSVAGSVLIETVRILSFINEKDRNVVYFDAIHQKNLNGFIQSEIEQTVTMKGYQEQISLARYLRHEELASVLSSLSTDNVQKLSCFRSDFDLFVILKDLKSQMNLRPVGVTLKAIQILRQAYVATSKVPLNEVLRDWILEISSSESIRAADGAGSDDGKSERVKVLSAVTMLYLNLVSKPHFTVEHKDALVALVKSPDKRVAANAIEVLTFFETAIDLKVVRSLEKADVRVGANSLIHEAREEIKSSVVKSLAKMLKDKQPSVIASALFAIGEIAQIHRGRNLVYYSTQTDFVKLVTSLDHFVQHPNSMVRRQGMIAARKAADEAVLERVILLIVQADSELLIEEANKYLGSSWQHIGNTTKAA